MPPQITCASALPGKTGKHENRIFHSVGPHVLYAQCTCALSFWKKKLSSAMCLIAFNICWDSKIDIPLILSIDFYSRLDKEQLPSFALRLTPWQTWLTQSMCVTDSRMLCSIPRTCLAHRVDRFDSEWWFSSDQWYFKLYFVFLVKKACSI